MTQSRTEVQRRHRHNALLVFVPSLIASLVLFYFVLIWPFSAGFDLISVGQGKGVQISALLQDANRPLKNQLLGLSALVLEGEFNGTEARAAAVSDIEGFDRPFVVELSIRQEEEAVLIVGLASPDTPTGAYDLKHGVTAYDGEDYLLSESLLIDEAQGQIRSTGQTRVSVEGSQLSSETGFSADEEGNFDLR